VRSGRSIAPAVIVIAHHTPQERIPPPNRYATATEKILPVRPGRIIGSQLHHGDAYGWSRSDTLVPHHIPNNGRGPRYRPTSEIM
jgi:hypothetical protein